MVGLVFLPRKYYMQSLSPITVVLNVANRLFISSQAHEDRILILCKCERPSFK